MAQRTMLDVASEVAPGKCVSGVFCEGTPAEDQLISKLALRIALGDQAATGRSRAIKSSIMSPECGPAGASRCPSKPANCLKRPVEC
jgi:hypothetical protein